MKTKTLLLFIILTSACIDTTVVPKDTGQTADTTPDLNTPDTDAPDMKVTPDVVQSDCDPACPTGEVCMVEATKSSDRGSTQIFHLSPIQNPSQTRLK